MSIRAQTNHYLLILCTSINNYLKTISGVVYSALISPRRLSIVAPRVPLLLYLPPNSLVVGGARGGAVFVFVVHGVAKKAAAAL